MNHRLRLRKKKKRLCALLSLHLSLKNLFFSPPLLVLPPPAPPLTQGHADAVALGVQQPSDLSQVAVPLAVVLVHGALQQVGVVGFEDPGDPFLCALHKHARLLGVHEVPHALVGLVARVLQSDERPDSMRGKKRGEARHAEQTKVHQPYFRLMQGGRLVFICFSFIYSRLMDLFELCDSLKAARLLKCEYIFFSFSTPFFPFQ